MNPLNTIPLIQALFIFYFYVRPLHKVPAIVKTLFVVILIAVTFNSYLYIFTKFTIADFGFPKWSLMIIESLFYMNVFLSIFVFVKILLNTLYKFIARDFSKSLIPSESVIYAGVVFFLSLYIGCLGVSNGFSAPINHYYDIKVENLSNSANGFKIVQLSDLHINKVTTKSEIREIVQRVNDIHADLVVITGDFVDGKVEQLNDITNILFELKSQYGTYAVSGNHEMYSGYKEWLDYFEKGGIKFLENSSVIISDYNSNHLINLCGVIDPKSSRYDLPKTDVKSAILNIDKDLPIVFLSHRPNYGIDLRNIADLTLTGHTHGGMMIGFDKIIGIQNEGMTSGLYDLGRERVIVSNGTRINAAVPFRIGNPSEINIITLHQ